LDPKLKIVLLESAWYVPEPEGLYHYEAYSAAAVDPALMPLNTPFEGVRSYSVYLGRRNTVLPNGSYAVAVGSNAIAVPPNSLGSSIVGYGSVYGGPQSVPEPHPTNVSPYRIVPTRDR
jgi:hypothetical protein